MSSYEHYCNDWGRKEGGWVNTWIIHSLIATLTAQAVAVKNCYLHNQPWQELIGIRRQWKQNLYFSLNVHMIICDRFKLVFFEFGK